MKFIEQNIGHCHPHGLIPIFYIIRCFLGAVCTYTWLVSVQYVPSLFFLMHYFQNQTRNIPQDTYITSLLMIIM